MNQACATPSLFEHRIAVRWGDLDAFNHVNNANYLRYLEEARVKWLATLIAEWDSQPTAPVLAASHLNYRAPINWPAEVQVKLYAERLGNSSLTLGHRIESLDGSILHCDGNVVLVWIDRTSGKSAALPQALRAACT